MNVKRQGTSGKEILVVETDLRKAKKKVMRNKCSLGTTKVYVDHDLTYKKREIQRKISKVAEEHRKQEKIVRVEYQKVCPQGGRYRWNEEKKRLQKEERPFFIVRKMWKQSKIEDKSKRKKEEDREYKRGPRKRNRDIVGWTAT